MDFWDADAFGLVLAEGFGGILELEGGVAGIEAYAEVMADEGFGGGWRAAEFCGEDGRAL